MLPSVGITTGKADVFDTGQDHLNAVPVSPGGIPIFRGGKVVGGIGVAGVAPALAEYAATLAAAGAGRGLDFAEPLGTPGAVFIDGLRLPFFGACPNITCIRKALKTQPPGSSPGTLSSGTFLIQPRDGLQAPENYILGPRGEHGGGRTVDRRGAPHRRRVGRRGLAHARDDPAADQPARAHDDRHLGRDRRDPRPLPHARRRRVFTGRGDDEGAQRLLLQHARGLRGPARHRARRAGGARSLYVGAGAASPARAGPSRRARSASRGSRSSRRGSISRSSSNETAPNGSAGRGSISTSTTRRTPARKGPAPRAAATARSSTRAGSCGSPAARRSTAGTA